MRLIARFFRRWAHTKSERTGCEVELTSFTEGHSTTDSDTAFEGMAEKRSGRVVGHLAVWKASFVIMGVLLLVTGCQPNDDLIVTAITADVLAGSFVGLREEVSVLITPTAIRAGQGDAFCLAVLLELEELATDIYSDHNTASKISYELWQDAVDGGSEEHDGLRTMLERASDSKFALTDRADAIYHSAVGRCWPYDLRRIPQVKRPTHLPAE